MKKLLLIIMIAFISCTKEDEVEPAVQKTCYMCDVWRVEHARIRQHHKEYCVETDAELLGIKNELHEYYTRQYPNASSISVSCFIP